MKPEKSIFAKHTGWDAPLRTTPEWDAAIANRKAEDKARLPFKTKEIAHNEI